VVFSPDSQLLASTSWGQKTVWIWNSSTGEPQYTLEGHTDAVDAAVFSLHSQLLASGLDDKTIMLWDLNTAPAKLVFRGHTD
jgi:WD40 repeat protein